MPDTSVYTLWDTSQPKAAPVQMERADLFIVTVGVRLALGNTSWEPWSFSTTEEAVELIGEVERGERRGQIGSLTAWKDGKLIGEIPTGTAMQEARQDKRDDGEHARLFSNGGL